MVKVMELMLLLVAKKEAGEMHLTVVFVALHGETQNLPSKGPKLCK